VGKWLKEKDKERADIKGEKVNQDGMEIAGDTELLL